MRRVTVLLVTVLVVLGTIPACGFTAGLSQETLDSLEELQETAEQISSDLTDEIEATRGEIRHICDVTEGKVTDFQDSLAAACEAIADENERQRCEERAERSAELIRQIREDCADLGDSGQ